MINGKLILYAYGKETSKGFPIKIYISDGKTKAKKYISLNLYSKKEHWDEKKIEPKKTHPNYLHLLDVVSEKKHLINKVLNDAYKSNWSLLRSVNEIINPTSEKTLNTFWLELVNEFRLLQLPKHRSYENHLGIFNGYNDNVRFEDIDYSFLVKYRDYKLINGCGPTGVHSYLRTIRAVYNEALRRELFTPKSFNNPFRNVLPKLEKTKSKSLTRVEIKLSIDSEMQGQYKDYNNCFLLCFYLGGIDLIDLANLRYDEHVKDGRVVFQRFKKGHTKEIIDNKIFPEAQAMLKQYDCAPYLVPIYKYVYPEYRKNLNHRLRIKLKTLGVESYFTSKSARYSFINIGKELLLNREVLEELTGHSKGDVHSIYESGFPNDIKDDVHRKILDSLFR